MRGATMSKAEDARDGATLELAGVALAYPLQSRVRDDCLVLGLFAEAGLDESKLAALRDALDRLAPLPVRLVVFSDRGARPADETDERWERCAPGSRAAALRLPQLEAAAGGYEPLGRFQPLLTALGVPTALWLPDAAADGGAGDEFGGAAGAVLGKASPEGCAALLLRLASDPPTRRRALANQRRHGTGPGPRRWRVEGVFDSSYSLALVNRRLALALEDGAEDGETVALFTYEQGDTPTPDFQATEAPERVAALWARSATPEAPLVSLRNAWPPRVRDQRGHVRVLGTYHWEETGFPAPFAADFNRVLDLITVGSDQTARFLQDAGVDVPIAVVGNGVDHLLEVVPEAPPCELPCGFRALHVSSAFPRKGVDVLLKAWRRAFRVDDDAVLIIKTHPNPHNDAAEQLAWWRAQDPGYPRVVLIDEDWTPAQMAGLYRSCQVLVAPSRGEGFGLPIAEAMLHRVPVMVTGWGGHRLFCDARTAWLIDYRLEPAKTHLSTPGSLWAEPDVGHLASLLRWHYQAPRARCAQRVERAHEQVCRQWTWRNVAERTRAAVAAVVAHPSLERAPRIAWIGTWGSRCGIADYSAHLLQGFSEQEVTVFAPADERPEQPDDARVRRLWNRASPFIARLLMGLREAAPEVAVIQHHWGYISLDTLCGLARTLQRRGVLVFVEFHNTRDAPAWIGTPGYQQVLGRCARLLVHSLDDVQHLQRYGLVENVTLLPLAVYPWTPPPARALAARRVEQGLIGKMVLASYGFVRPHKGLLSLVEAMPTLLAEHPRLHLLLVCARYPAADSAREIERLRARVKALGLGASITLETAFLPEDEALSLLCLADLIAFPYRESTESSSAAVRAGIAAGRPIIVTPLPLFDNVRDAVNVLPGTDQQAITRGLSEELERLRDADYRRAAQERTRRHARLNDVRVLSARLRGLITGVWRGLIFS